MFTFQRFVASTSRARQIKLADIRNEDNSQRIRDVLMAIPILAAVQSFVIGVDIIPSADDGQFELDRQRKFDNLDHSLTKRLFRTSRAYLYEPQLAAGNELTAAGNKPWFKRICLVDKAKFRLQRITGSSFSIGELVLYHSPIHEDPRKCVGRVIARPNDRIRPQNTDLYGEWLCHVPAGSVWIESLKSYAEPQIESNITGPIPIGLIYGRVLAVPLDSDIKADPEISIKQLKRVSYRGI